MRSSDKSIITMKNVLLRMSIMVLLLVNTSCVIYEGSYHGRVIDEETKVPIKNVVALGVWYDEHVSLAGGWSEYYDARETVTNETGDFEIPGQGFKALKGLSSMHLTIFKAGYSYYETYSLGPSRRPLEKERVIWEGDKIIIPLKKLTMDERKKGTLPPYPPSEAQRNNKSSRFMEEISKERRGQGLTVVD